MMTTKVRKLAVAGCLTAMMLNTALPVFALNSADIIDNPDGVTYAAFGDMDNAVLNVNAAVSRLEWNKYNVWSGQTIDYNFTANGQTVINYVKPDLTMANYSAIIGTIRGIGSSNGRIMLINPNGITSRNGKINPNSAGINTTTSVFMTTLNIDDAPAFFAADNPTSITFKTENFCAGNNVSNGILLENGNLFQNIRGLTLLANGIQVVDGARFDVNNNTANAGGDNFANVMVAGGGTLTFTDLTDTLTGVTANTVPAAVVELVDGVYKLTSGVRYYDVLPNGTFNAVYGSKYQIALCTDTLQVGPPDKDASTFKGLFGVVNYTNVSDTHNDETGEDYGSVLHIGTTLEADGLIGVNDNVIYMISKTLGTGDPTIIQPTIQFCVNSGVQINNTPYNNPANAGTNPPDPPPGAPYKAVTWTGVTNNATFETEDPIDPNHATPLANAWEGTCQVGLCDGRLDYEFDCNEEPPPPPPEPPEPPSPPPGDGGSDAGLLGLLGFAGFGFLTPAAPAAAAPVLTGEAAPVRTCPDMAAMPVYDECGNIKYLKIVKK